MTKREEHLSNINFYLKKLTEITGIEHKYYQESDIWTVYTGVHSFGSTKGIKNFETLLGNLYIHTTLILEKEI